MSKFVREGGKCFDDDGDMVRWADYNRCTVMSFVDDVGYLQAAANAPLLSIDNNMKDGIVQ
jgi:hypothetical protein